MLKTMYMQVLIRWTLWEVKASLSQKKRYDCQFCPASQFISSFYFLGELCDAYSISNVDLFSVKIFKKFAFTFLLAFID